MPDLEIRSHRKWIPFLTFAVVILVFDVFAAILGIDPRGGWGEVVFGMSIGIFFAQVVVAAVGTTMLNMHLGTRLVVGTAVTGGIAMALALNIREARSPVPYILAAVVFCQWLIYQIPLWGLRYNGWSLQFSSAAQAEPSRDEGQFGLRHIFVWTGIVAVFLAIAKLVLGFATDASSPNSADWSIFGIMTLGNSVLALPIIWAALVRCRFRAWMAGAATWATLLSPLQLYVISCAIPVSPGEVWLFGAVNLFHMLVAATFLLALRFAGLRLVERGEVVRT